LFKTEIALGAIATRRSPGDVSETNPAVIAVCYKRSAVVKKKRSSSAAVSGASDP
jgi:hypothetical protein